jgi:putative oxidoreductase
MVRATVGLSSRFSRTERRVQWTRAEDVMSALFVLGRTIFGGFFAYNGINHLQHSREIGQYADSKGVPAAEQAVQATGALLLIGGVSVMLGLKPRQGLAALIGFLIPVSLQMHRFWDEQDPQKRQNDMVHFMKNMALVGAALAMLEIRDPWPASVDEMRAEEEMFVNLDGRDLRALPA